MIINLYLVNCGPTERQVECIRKIEETLGILFHGDTAADASTFIDEHLEESIRTWAAKTAQLRTRGGYRERSDRYLKRGNERVRSYLRYDEPNIRGYGGREYPRGLGIIEEDSILTGEEAVTFGVVDHSWGDDADDWSYPYGPSGSHIDYD